MLPSLYDLMTWDYERRIPLCYSMFNVKKFHLRSIYHNLAEKLQRNTCSRSSQSSVIFSCMLVYHSSTSCTFKISFAPGYASINSCKLCGPEICYRLVLPEHIIPIRPGKSARTLPLGLVCTPPLRHSLGIDKRVPAVENFGVARHS